MKRYAVGLDGGGTKTAVTIVDENGLEVHTFTSGAINYNGQDEASVQASLAEIFRTIDRVCDGLGHCTQVCIGAAGVSNPTVTTRLEASVRACGYKGSLFITGDQDTALSGAHNRELGIILIAGTGSICYGKNEAGDIHRAGGYGYLIDDEGSGYSIGRDLLSVVVRAHDGRLPATVITGMVFEQLGMTSIGQIIGFVYDKQTNKKDIAALAPILSQACELGDQSALAIADKSARSLLELVVPVAEKLSMQEGVLAMAGSALLKNSFIQSAFINGLKERYPAMTCITPKRDAASGAALMALNRLQ
jgi:N-acetylglucosamine kinase-like BadF-type ATPase